MFKDKIDGFFEFFKIAEYLRVLALDLRDDLPPMYQVYLLVSMNSRRKRH